MLCSKSICMYLIAIRPNYEHGYQWFLYQFPNVVCQGGHICEKVQPKFESKKSSKHLFYCWLLTWFWYKNLVIFSDFFRNVVKEKLKKTRFSFTKWILKSSIGENLSSKSTSLIVKRWWVRFVNWDFYCVMKNSVIYICLAAFSHHSLKLFICLFIIEVCKKWASHQREIPAFQYNLDLSHTSGR
jgi:hypothetical protein